MRCPLRDDDVPRMKLGYRIVAGGRRRGGWKIEEHRKVLTLSKSHVEDKANVLHVRAGKVFKDGYQV